MSGDRIEPGISHALEECESLPLSIICRLYITRQDPKKSKNENTDSVLWSLRGAREEWFRRVATFCSFDASKAHALMGRCDND